MKNISLNEALALLDICPIAMLLVNQDNSIHGYNQAFTALTGEAAATLDEGAPDDLLAPLLGEGTLINWISPEGNEHWLSVEAITLTDTSVVVRFYLDVTEKLRLKNERDTIADELRKQSLRDEHLSSLLSRHGILVSIEPLVARSRRYNSPLSIIAMSIDNAQQHDDVLRKLSFILKDQTRWADLIGCNDSRDFILVLQETTRDSAMQLVEKLSTKLAAMNKNTSDPLLASYGITQCEKNDDAASLLERAEAALTEARGNENRTSIAM